MTDNKQSQAARNAADRRLREAYTDEWRTFMQEEHAKRGLTWNPRPSKEEREALAREKAQAAARERIEREARKAGIKVAFVAGEETVEEKAARIAEEAEEQERLNAEAPVEQEDEAQQAAGWR